MCAAECACLPAIKFFIKSGFDVTYQVKRQHAVDFVKRKNLETYSEIVLELLKANSPFPRDFNEEGVTDALKSFVSLMADMHRAIKDKNMKKIIEIIDSQQQLTNFYLHINGLRSKNISAYRAAEALNFRDVLKVFCQKNVFPAPFENFYDLNIITKPAIKLIYRANHFFGVGGEAGRLNRQMTASPGSESNPNGNHNTPNETNNAKNPEVAIEMGLLLKNGDSANGNDDDRDDNEGNGDSGSANRPQRSKFLVILRIKKFKC